MNHFNDAKGFNTSRSKMSIVRFKDIFLFLLSAAIVLHIPIGLGVCDKVNNIALTLGVLGRHIFISNKKVARKENRGFLHDMVVNRFGKYI